MSVQATRECPSMWNDKYNQTDYVYGTAPCQWLLMNQHRLPTTGLALAIADGEGRNGVFLAEQGLQVTSVDLSEVGLRKAERLAASRGVALNTVQSDLSRHPVAPESLAIAVSIYAHLPSKIRSDVHQRIGQGLQPGGLFLLEAFHPRQRDYPSGGPRDPDLLYQVEDVLADLPDLTIIDALEGQTLLAEGYGHVGLGYVTCLVLQKGASL
jgi:hypothetical protein